MPEMNTLFACDLDNTLIHSYKKKKDNDLCIERINGMEQGFIGKETLMLLSEIQKQSVFVPVTTRSVEQYRRITWPCSKPRFALVANGAILLQNGVIDGKWLEETRSIVSGSFEEINALLSRYRSDRSLLRVRIVDEIYLFVYCKENAKTWADEHRNDTSLSVVVSGNKVYFLPPGINKGAAVDRIAHKTECSLLMCAGDSEMDLPMLNISDFCFCPEKLMNKITGQGKKLVCKNVDLGKFALSEGLQLLDSIKE